MHVPEIIEVKNHLEALKQRGLILQWELPYENLLTRLSAAIFFVDLPEHLDPEHNEAWSELAKFEHFHVRANQEKKLSGLQYRVTFNNEEKTAALESAATASSANS